MKRTALASCAVSIFLSAVAHAPLDYVEPRIGTANSEARTAGLFGKGTEELGQTLPAVLEPNGMNFWTAQTRDTERKCVAPYYFADTLLMGFRNSHWIVGGCTQDYGSMTLTALSGTPRYTPVSRATRMDKSAEISRPDYYSIYLPDEGIRAEMTGRSRSGIFRFTYDKAGKGYLVVNPNSDEAMGHVAVDPETRTVTGCNPVHRIYQGKGLEAGFSGYFVVEWPENLHVTGFGVFSGDAAYPGRPEISGVPQAGAYIEFDVNEGDTVTVKAASSFTSVAAAKANLNAEIPHGDFDLTRRELADIWNARLGQIDVRGGTPEELTKFYSALYRASFLPRTFNDVEGTYPSFAGGKAVMHTRPGTTYYDDFSMWDTYRALHPLLVILHPAASGEMMQSLVDKYEQGGWLPVFPCWNSYTSAMIGDHCIAAIADAWVKGVRNFDIQKAYQGMRRNAFNTPASEAGYKDGMGRRALKSYLAYGYIPLEDSVPDAYHRREQVSRTLEYAFDDFALSRVARELGYTADADSLEARSGNWRNVFHSGTGYVRGRHADGSFDPVDAPFSFSKSITEGAPCHYTWYVPHDQPGLMDAMGGRGMYVEKLDSMFSHRRYWHGNEPCHQVAWLYDYAGEPWKTQKQVRHIMDTEYLATPGGLSGNDDAGQMSAWYVFGALGFYPVCPATPVYALGSPVFPYTEIHLENGRTFTVIARDASPENIYVISARLNGRPYDKNYITHNDIVSGSTLELEMGPNPSMTRGRTPDACPPVSL